MAEPRYYVGVDLGQVSDWTALAVLERPGEEEPRPGVAPPEPVYALVHLERLPLGTSYPAVVTSVDDLMGRLPAGSPLVVDATGVGRAVVDLLRGARLRPVPVVVHGGQQTTVDDHGYRRVPKRELVGTTQVALQQQRLKFAGGLPLVPTLKEELQNFAIKITDAGNDVYEAWREGQHDDLVFAVCLACWYAEDVAGPAERIARMPAGRIERPAASDAHRTEREARAFFGPGVDPRSGPRIGRNGPGRY